MRPSGKSLITLAPARAFSKLTRLELPNYPPLLRQLRNLSFERLPAGGVRISVPERAGHDDLAMALCLAAYAVMGGDLPVVSDEIITMEDLYPDLADWSISPY
jgi:hypothetical protein